MRDNPLIPVAACVLYGALIMTGQYVMQNRPSWNWRRLMAFWNLGLSAFSWIGMARTLPQLAHNLYYMSLRDNLCTDRKYFVAMNLVSCHSEVDGDMTLSLRFAVWGDNEFEMYRTIHSPLGLRCPPLSSCSKSYVWFRIHRPLGSAFHFEQVSVSVGRNE